MRDLAPLTITKVAVDEQMSNNCYLLRCVCTGDQVLIDAADSAATLLPLIGDADLTTVVTTHQHWDHHRALADVVAATGAEVVAGRARRRRRSPPRPACRSPAPSTQGDKMSRRRVPPSR